MQFSNSFEVPLPPAQAWAFLLDIQRIAPSMPGAELTEVVDESTYKGKVAVRLGPVALSFAGTAKFEDIDHAAHKAGDQDDERGNDETQSLLHNYFNTGIRNRRHPPNDTFTVRNFNTDAHMLPKPRAPQMACAIKEMAIGGRGAGR
jgi:hypothetical protein